MSSDFLSLIEGAAHAVEIALDLDTIAKRPHIRQLATDLVAFGTGGLDRIVTPAISPETDGDC